MLNYKLILKRQTFKLDLSCYSEPTKYACQITASATSNKILLKPNYIESIPVCLLPYLLPVLAGIFTGILFGNAIFEYCNEKEIGSYCFID